LDMVALFNLEINVRFILHWIQYNCLLRLDLLDMCSCS